jgi:hypothetical protein
MNIIYFFHQIVFAVLSIASGRKASLPSGITHKQSRESEIGHWSRIARKTLVCFTREERIEAPSQSTDSLRKMLPLSKNQPGPTPLALILTTLWVGSDIGFSLPLRANLYGSKNFQESPYS